MGFVSALGLDVGQKRIGVAGCDGTGLIATGLTTIERKSFQQVIDELQSMIGRSSGANPRDRAALHDGWSDRVSG